MPKTTRQLEDTETEHDPEELDVQNRETGVTFETKDFKVTASCVAASCESGTSSDGQDEDDQDDTYLSVSLAPKGIRTSRKRPKMKSRCSPVQRRMRTVEEEPLLPAEVEAAEVGAQEKENRAEVAQKATERCEISDTIMNVLLILIVFMIFMHLILALVVTVRC
ncbi:UNVERIFIED_CONTAM: hypothetical protein H355_010897 [Colinus virginianus]|nr:hypothetical protein H355_010897 [Colinus virginianus]